jgi:hypothetical protein
LPANVVRLKRKPLRPMTERQQAKAEREARLAKLAVVKEGYVTRTLGR